MHEHTLVTSIKSVGMHTEEVGMTGFDSTSARGWLRFSRIAILSLGLVIAIAVTAAVEVEAESTKPDVTINQASGQADPTNGLTINYTVVFSEEVTGFSTGDVTLGGTAGATTGAVTGSGTTYNVAVSGMTGDGTVIATIAAGVAQDGYGNTNNASTSTDNTVLYDATDPTDPTSSSDSHTVSMWDNDSTVDIQISGASDAGSGVDGFEVVYMDPWGEQRARAVVERRYVYCDIRWRLVLPHRDRRQRRQLDEHAASGPVPDRYDRSFNPHRTRSIKRQLLRRHFSNTVVDRVD